MEGETILWEEEQSKNNYVITACKLLLIVFIFITAIYQAVSFIDGKKYHNSNEEIALMKDTSDRLCLKYGLSIVKTEKARFLDLYKLFYNTSF